MSPTIRRESVSLREYNDPPPPLCLHPVHNKVWITVDIVYMFTNCLAYNPIKWKGLCLDSVKISVSHVSFYV